jgi:ribonuclease P protein component
MMAKRFTLGKQERLKSRKIIEQLFSEGKRFSVNPYRVFYLLPPAIDSSQANLLQFGVGASARNFKKSPDRNRIKRVTREAWRLQKNTLDELLQHKQQSLFVFVIYTGKELPQYDEVFGKLTLILKKLRQLVDENNTSHS